jgi:hypothetical protein
MEIARTKWVRVNAVGQGYKVQLATGKLPEPEWPDTPWGEILLRAFKGRYVTSLDDPVCKDLRGEV